MSAIYLAPGLHIDSEVTEILHRRLREVFGFPIKQTAPFLEADEAYDHKREQYSSVAILHQVTELIEPDATRILGITTKDIFIPMLSFIFGQAQLSGQAALISLARLQQTFYSLPPNPILLADRICKEAVHELGHTFGLIHCLDIRCVMSLSTSIEQVDVKRDDFCRSCRTVLLERIDAIGQYMPDVEEEQ